MPPYKDNDGRWRFRFAFNGKRHGGSTPKSTNTRKAALALEQALIEKLMARQYTGKMPTVAEFAPRFLEYQAGRTKPLTQRNQRTTVNNHIVPNIGRRALDDVDKSVIDELVTTWIAEPAVAKTINTRLGTFRRMLSLAVEWDILARVPRFVFLKVPKTSPRYLMYEEAAKLVDAAAPQWRAMILVGLRTGLRVGELRGLQWGDVDFDRRVLQVRRTDPGRPAMDATAPKGNRERTVPLTDEALAALRELHEAAVGHRRSSDWVWPAPMWRGQKHVRARSEKGCWHGLEHARKAAGLVRVGWHTLRHTYASWLVMRSVPLRVVQQWCGHASITETEKYAHLAPDFAHGAINLLDLPIASALAQPGAPPTPAAAAPDQGATKALPEGVPERSGGGKLPEDA